MIVQLFFSLQHEIQRRKTTAPPSGELVEIAAEYKGLVIGAGGDNLRNISTKTGAKLIRKNGEVYIVSGNRQERQQAKLVIGISIVSDISYEFTLYKYVFEIPTKRKRQAFIFLCDCPKADRIDNYLCSLA